VSRFVRILAFSLAALLLPAAVASAEQRDRPLAFEENRGQTDPEILFLSSAPGYEVFLTLAEAVLAPSGAGGALHLRWLEANPAPRVVTEGELPAGLYNLLENEPGRRQSGRRRWSRVRLEGLWPGIDLVFYGNPEQLEHDFLVAPGADPGRIVLALDGVEQARIDDQGDLVATLEIAGEVRLQRPVAWQEIEGRRREVACRYRMLPGPQIGFVLEDWDRTRPLVIDPIFIGPASPL
jgi:hypothetical protein